MGVLLKEAQAEEEQVEATLHRRINRGQAKAVCGCRDATEESGLFASVLCSNAADARAWN